MRVLLFLQRFSCCILYQNGLFESRWNNAWKRFVRKSERTILTLCRRENGLARRRKEPCHEQDQTHRTASCDLASQGSSLSSSGNPTPSARVHFFCGCCNRRRSHCSAFAKLGLFASPRVANTRKGRLRARRTHERRKHQPPSSSPPRLAFRTSSTTTSTTTSAPTAAPQTWSSLVSILSDGWRQRASRHVEYATTMW